MSKEKYDDAELQRSFDYWAEENKEEIVKEKLDMQEIKGSFSDGYQDYHDRLKNGFLLIFREFNLV